MTTTTTTVTDLLKLPPGAVDLNGIDARGKPGFEGNKSDGTNALAALAAEVPDLQERLYAEASGGGRRGVLMVIQGMDTSGKGGVMRHCVGLLDPQGVDITGFKPPTEAERRHDFLWRIHKAVPKPGMVGIFDRSHYEDVLVARVRKLVPAAEITRRYPAINEFEAQLVDAGTTIIKCFLHISKEEQKSRLKARLDDPTKHWKYNPGDIDDRRLWEQYQRAYEVALNKCNTKAAPWFVIPADRKWYRNWAITSLLIEHLRGLDPQWPAAAFDLEEENQRLASS